jgi:hypothetical protein
MASRWSTSVNLERNDLRPKSLRASNWPASVSVFFAGVYSPAWFKAETPSSFARLDQS